MLTSILLWAAAVVRAHLIHTYTTIEAGRGRLGTLIDILLAGLTMESRWAGADIVRFKGRALATIGTGIGCTWVGKLAGFTLKIRQQLIIALHCEMKETKVPNLKFLATYLTTQVDSGSGSQ